MVFFLMLERAWLGKILKKLPVFIQISYTFIVVVVSWVFFSMEFSLALDYLAKMVDFSKIPLHTHINDKVIYTFILGVIFAFMAPQQRHLNFFNLTIKRISSKPTLAVISFPVFILIFILSFMKLMTSDFNPFIYYRF